MNITPLPTSLPTATVFNPQTESLRRENHQREIITQTAPLNQSAAEKGVASERERAKTPAQFNEQIDFASLEEQANVENSTITDQQQQEDSSQQNAPQQGERASDTAAGDGGAQAAVRHRFGHQYLQRLYAADPPQAGYAALGDAGGAVR